MHIVLEVYGISDSTDLSCFPWSQYKNLEKPYATRCAAKKLKTYSSYTVEGCFFECKAERIVKMCGCRTPGYKGTFESWKTEEMENADWAGTHIR